MTKITVASMVYIDYAALNAFWGEGLYEPDERLVGLPHEVAAIGGRWFWQYADGQSLFRRRIFYVREAMLISPFGHWSWRPIAALQLAEDQSEAVQTWRQATLQSGEYWNK